MTKRTPTPPRDTSPAACYGPTWALELILDTVRLDAQSSAFDRTLRRDLLEALDLIEFVDDTPTQE